MYYQVQQSVTSRAVTRPPPEPTMQSANLQAQPYLDLFPKLLEMSDRRFVSVITQDLIRLFKSQDQCVCLQSHASVCYHNVYVAIVIFP